MQIRHIIQNSVTILVIGATVLLTPTNLKAQQNISGHTTDRILITEELSAKAKKVEILDVLIDMLDRYKQFSANEFYELYEEYLSKSQYTNPLVHLKDSFKLQSTKSRRKYDYMYTIKELCLKDLVEVLDLNNVNARLEEIRYLLERITNFNTIYRFNEHITESIIRDNTSSFILENISEVAKRYNHLITTTFHFYANRNLQKKKLIAIELNHGNDVLDFLPMYDGGKPLNREEVTGKTLFFGNNHDRDMTGAFRFDFYTEYFQMRVAGIINPYLKKIWNFTIGKRWRRMKSDSDPFYSYQSIFATGLGETPMLRDTAIFKTPAAFDPRDRPYASYIGYGISKHRVHRKGLYRTYQEFSVGTIGSGSPYGIQALLHRDVIDASLNPNGWEAQIAAGDTSQKRMGVKSGRAGVQAAIRHEFTFLSGNKNLTYLKNTYIPKWLNIYISGQFQIGCKLTAADIGLGYSNYSFLRQNGNGQVKKTNPLHPSWMKFTINGGIYYRRVIHNTFLEGFGYIKNKPDEDAYTPRDMHTIDGNYIQRNLMVGNFGFSMSKNKVCIYFKYDFTAAEIIKYVNGVNKYPHYFENEFKYKSDTFYYKRRHSGVNFWGTLGFVFSI